MMALNNLLASPSFEAWREGEPMDVERLLRAADGHPRLSIVYTAHLADEERLFVTALLLDKVKTWMRRQGGTGDLRALVYMDEIFGYFPPHPANPPPKRPLLTLLKQARAQGVGVVLATQNPVDLDYKGLANMGTWFVGKLQTDQDRARLRDGLLDAGMEAGTLEKLLAATRKRVFLLHDVHRPRPCLLQSRWAMSYLRGPLTRDEIARLMKERKAAAPAAKPATAGPATAKLRERLEKKRRDLAAAEQDLTGRKREKWAAWGSAVLSNIGLITGRKRTISYVPTAMGKQRMENTAESRVEALKAESGSAGGVDPERLQEKQVVPARGDLDLLRYDVLWVY